MFWAQCRGCKMRWDGPWSSTGIHFQTCLQDGISRERKRHTFHIFVEQFSCLFNASWKEKFVFCCLAQIISIDKKKIPYFVILHLEVIGTSIHCFVHSQLSPRSTTPPSDPPTHATSDCVGGFPLPVAWRPRFRSLFPPHCCLTQIKDVLRVVP